ncbi:hypothetical protein C8F04DRAFT_339422 [Mycena alexandri]|uniref:Uncharacterized protein n=1 Tax=Mycena alexandri TaxID=1745969 RepID=A0AAD6TJF2_9AGAR|nr:hypothetical protein C8F04DRAFT_339422 [Mycena alexandri]
MGLSSFSDKTTALTAPSHQRGGSTRRSALHISVRPRRPRNSPRNQIICAISVLVIPACGGSVGGYLDDLAMHAITPHRDLHGSVGSSLLSLCSALELELQLVPIGGARCWIWSWSWSWSCGSEARQRVVGCENPFTSWESVLFFKFCPPGGLRDTSSTWCTV